VHPRWLITAISVFNTNSLRRRRCCKSIAHGNKSRDTTYCRSSAFVGSSAQRYCVWKINGLRKANNTNADVIESAKKTEQIFQDTLEALKKLRRNCNDSPQWVRSNLIDRQLACLADSNNFSTKNGFPPERQRPANSCPRLCTAGCRCPVQLSPHSADDDDDDDNEIMALTALSGQSNLTKRPHRRRTWAVQWYSLIARSRQCAPHPT